MTDKTIPKSLHTVTVIVRVAKLIHRNRTISDVTAVHEACGVLGYSVTNDPYGLAAAALKQLEN